MMTDEQCRVFAKIAQLGMATDLTHPFEWLTWYTSHLPQLAPYTEVPAKYEAAMDAFTAFMRGAAGSPEEAEELAELDHQGLTRLINRWYDRAQAQTTQDSDEE